MAIFVPEAHSSVTRLPTFPGYPGTVGTPFSAVVGEEADGRTVTYQTITSQAPCHEYSLEELRLADLAQ